jgi:hypothetical protein
MNQRVEGRIQIALREPRRGKRGETGRSPENGFLVK